MTFRRVVVGADGSHASRAAVNWVAEEARDHGGHVCAVKVLTYSGEFMRDLSFDTLTNWRKQLAATLRCDWVSALREARVDYDCKLVEADSVADGLLRAADREGADAIVVGSAGHGGLASRIVGGPIYRLTHESHCPVLVIPQNAGTRSKPGRTR